MTITQRLRAFHDPDSQRRRPITDRRHAMSRRPHVEGLEGRQLLTTLIMINDPLIVEGTGGSNAAAFTVSLNAPSSRSVTVNYQTADSTARAGLDYTTTKGTLTFAAGQTSKTVLVPIVTDSVIETMEVFSLRLSNATNATLFDASGNGLIQDDDTPVTPELTITDPRIVEGNSGTKLMVFDVKLNTAVTTKTVSVTVGTSNGSATAGSDYVAKSQVLTFSPGQTVKQFAVTINGDTTPERQEALYGTLSGANVKIGKATGAGVIQNDDVW
jgi:hypothetical protein